MSKLVPERRMDKNGKVSTKWVRPATENANKLLISAPVIAPEEDDLNSIKYVFLQSRMGRSDRFSLDDFNPEAVRLVNKMLKEARYTSANRAEGNTFQVLQQVYSAIESSKGKLGHSIEWCLTPFNNLAVFGEIACSEEAVNTEVWMISNGLKRLFETRDFLAQATEEERAQAIALATVVSRVSPPFLHEEITEKLATDEMRLASDDLALFVIERPHDAEQIIRIINERSTDDVDLIRELLDHEEKALGSGLL